MLPASEITRQIIASRKALSLAVEQRDYAAIQHQIDILSCLIDESPESVHWKIRGLIEKFEGLRRQSVN